MTQEENDNRKWLAAEYALGALDNDARQHAEKLYDSDAAFRSAVDGWNNQLAPMLEGVPAIEPGKKVWGNIAARTGVSEPMPSGGIWNSLKFWRGFSLVSAVLATASVAALLFYLNSGRVGDTDGTAPLVATLNATGQAPMLLARFDAESGSLVLRAALPSEEKKRSAELWLIPSDGKPKSLGLVESTSTKISLSGRNLELIRDGGTLAISMEPAGGSPTGAPTGPVIASGKLRKL